MNKTLLFILILVSINSIAQNALPEIQKSEIFKDDSKESYIVYAKDDGNGGFYTVSRFRENAISPAGGYYLEHYDRNLKLIKNDEYAPEYYTYEKHKYLRGIVSNNNEVHIIDLNYNVKQKAYICQAHSANIKDFKFSVTELFRLERSELPAYATLDISKPNAVGFTANENAFAIALNIQSDKSKTIRLYSFDNNLKKILDHTYTKDVRRNDFVFHSIEIAENGSSIYMLNSSRSEENNENKFTYDVNHITQTGELSAIVKGDTDYTESVKMLRTDNRLVLAGFYKEKKSKFFGGITYIEIDPVTLQSVKVKHTPFLEQMMKDKKKFKFWEGRSYTPVFFKPFIVTDDGSIIINAEEQYSVTDSRYNRTVYFREDIISASINKEGETIWVSNINKKQGGEESEMPYMSYTSIYKNNKVSYFINAADEVKNLNDGSIQFKDSGKKNSALTMVTIDENGLMDYNILLDYFDNEVPFMTANGIVLPNAVFFMGRRGSKKQLLKIGL